MKSSVAIAVAILTAGFAIVIACATAALPETCANGTTSCENACVDLTNDNGNCGACNAPCTNGQVCSSGKCSSSCGANETLCNGVCVSGGKCGGSDGGSSDGGDSGTTCTQGKTACKTDAGIACVDTATDENNCGSCNAPCTNDETCISGKCTLTCEAGTSLCVDASVQYCADFTSDNDNCGSCGDYCDGGACQSSQCVTTATAVEIFPPSGTLEDPGAASVWSARYYTVTFAQAQTIVGVEWRANIATSDSIYAEIWNPSTQASLVKGTTVNGSGTETFYKSTFSYALQASTPYLIGIFMSNSNTVFPRKDTPSFAVSVSGPARKHFRDRVLVDQLEHDGHLSDVDERVGPGFQIRYFVRLMS